MSVGEGVPRSVAVSDQFWKEGLHPQKFFRLNILLMCWWAHEYKAWQWRKQYEPRTPAESPPPIPLCVGELGKALLSLRDRYRIPWEVTRPTDDYILSMAVGYIARESLEFLAFQANVRQLSDIGYIFEG